MSHGRRQLRSPDASGFLSLLRSCVACALLALAPGAAATADEPCACSGGEGMSRWCERHDVGWIAGVEIRSRFLFDAVDAHGHEVDPDSFTCAECRAALDTDGYCAEHRIGFVEGKAYFSRLTYLLAQGSVIEPSAVDCPVCRGHVGHAGWCSSCAVGIVGDVAISDRARFDEILALREVLRRAALEADRCEHCGVAAWTDTVCPFHKIRYEKGVPVPSAAAPP